jgi:hypothetical protein
VQVFFLSTVNISDLLRKGKLIQGVGGGNPKEREKWEDLRVVGIKLYLQQVARE